MVRSRPTLAVIVANNVVAMLGFGVWQALFSNFAVEELGVQAGQMGLIHAIREIPGLLGFLVGVLALVMAELRIAGVSIVLMGAGIFLTGIAQDVPSLVAVTLVMSVGFHFFYTSNTSAVLITAGPREAPKVLGRLNSLGALAFVVSTLFILGTLDRWGYRVLFQIAGGVVVIGGLCLLPFARQRAQTRRTRRRTPVRRKYWIYYALEFLMGSRRHILSTFAVFLLVREYQVTPQMITLLLLVNNLIGTYLNQAMGNTVARFGERRVLTFSSLVLTLVFLGYAIVPLLPGLHSAGVRVPGVSSGGWTVFPAFSATAALLILLGLYVIDNVLFGFTIALQSYFQKIALSPEEITPNISLGQTLNHVAAVVVPVVGGLLWEVLGPQYTFLAGVVIAVLTLALARLIRVPAVEREEVPVGVS